MRCYHVLLALVLALGAAPAVLAQGSEAGKTDSERIDKLVQQLGSSKFAERARARQELQKIGEPALEALRQAVKSDDAEMRRAASELVNGIEARLLSASLLAPKRVKLDTDNMPVVDAVNELARQSGYAIQVVGDRSALADRKVTLHTGQTTFWEAFDQLCQQGGLVESSLTNPYDVRPIPRPRPRPLPIRPPIRIQPAPAPGILPPAPAIKPPAGGLNAQVLIQQQILVNGAVVPAQVVVQAPAAAQPGAAPPAPGVVGARLVRPRVPRPVAAGPIGVQPGTPQKLPTSYAGAVRVRAVPAPPGIRPAGDEKQVYLEVTPEPRLQGFSVIGTPELKKAVDDQGQTLTVAAEAPPNGGGIVGGPAIAARVYNPYLGNTGRQTVVLRLKAGEKVAKALKELAGTLTVQVLAPTEPLIKVDNVLKAAGKAAKRAGGGSLEVLAISKDDNGDYRVRVRLENLPGQGGLVPGVIAPAGGAVQVQIQVNGATTVINQGQGQGLPSLVDARGQAYQLVQMPSRSLRGVNGAFTQEMTLIFRPHAGQGEPASLVLNGQRTVTVSIPFRLENVPLP